jgi:hypothetical protein
MNIPTLSRRLATSLAVIMLSIFNATGTKAQCVAHPHNGNTLAPELRGLQKPAVQDGESFSGQLGSSESLDKEREDSEVTVLGLWKKIYYAGGALNDVGFAQFNAGGTELLNDSPVPDGGNNFCMGAWKKIGRRRYSLVHPFLLFDASGKRPIGVSIERSELIVSRDGNTFTGTWNQDNYDFVGNIIPNTHFEGTITGTRIAPDLPFPFPFPL